jgi:DNA-binding transcriptional regulator GbsR (MarR family)
LSIISVIKEISKIMHLSATMTRFILHWGEMGSRWGVNRSVAQIHALLYLSPDPLTAEEIADTLELARSNVSNALKELQSWELISLAHVMGDRRDHFRAEQDVWEMLRTVIEGRKRREIDPTIELLRDCVEDMESDHETPDEVRERIAATLEFLDEANRWYEQIGRLPRAILIKLMRMGAKVSKLVG